MTETADEWGDIYPTLPLRNPTESELRELAPCLLAYMLGNAGSWMYLDEDLIAEARKWKPVAWRNESDALCVAGVKGS
jgi:hypothetical protein